MIETYNTYKMETPKLQSNKPPYKKFTFINYMIKWSQVKLS